MMGPQQRRLALVAQHIAAANGESSSPTVLMRFPHCGEERTVAAPPASLLDNLPAGHFIEVTQEDSLSGSAARSAFILRGPAVDASEAPPAAVDAAPGSGGTVSAGPLELKPPQPGETVADLARRLEDDGLLFLPGALSTEQIQRLKEDFDRTPTDPHNPVDSGQGTPSHEAMVAKAIAEGKDPGWIGNKGVMSLWNRESSGRHLQYVDLDPCCAVAVRKTSAVFARCPFSYT
eukprot:COSAG06_NODE_9811_length_1810_cov_59.270299_2_plen_233_part_00